MNNGTQMTIDALTAENIRLRAEVERLRDGNTHMRNQSPWVERVGALKAILRETVEVYGKPGGPWNVPSDPGGWLDRARAAISEGQS